MTWKRDFYNAVHEWMKAHPDVYGHDREWEYFNQPEGFYVKDVLPKIAEIESISSTKEVDEGYSCCSSSSVEEMVEIYYLTKNGGSKRILFPYDLSELLNELPE